LLNKQNILFITIDSLRSDKIYGKFKKSQIPNIQKIINNSLFFPNTISSVDATDSSLGSMFTGTFPFNNKITFYKNHKKTNFFFNILKNYGYNLYSMLPEKAFFNTLSNSFDNFEKYEIDPYELLYQGIGNKIVQKLKSKSLVEPWIYYIHIMDLHPSGNKFSFPNKYQSLNYGSNDYEKTISGLDFWIGQFFENIDDSKTIFVLTSDHGDFIPEKGKRIDDVSNIQQKLKPIKKFIPLGENFWGSILARTKSFVKEIRILKNKENLNEFQKRSLYNRVEGHLFDEIIKVPLLLFIPGQKSRIFNHQISTIDIIPTLFDLLKIDFQSELNGSSLLRLVNNLDWKERALYIESASKSKKSIGKTFGVRTSQFKYFRERTNFEHSFLYDLKNDPLEMNNIISTNKETQEKMENLLQSFISKSTEKEKILKIIKKKQWGF